jgi:uncharacterized protein YbgA (DUF1722 family)/uncharacterized protein YbbK (DUF523 family)
VTGGADRRIRLGVSACLLGERVRFDSGHKRDAFLVEELGRFVDWVPVCPEVEVGMGTPRESLRLMRSHHEIRLVANKSGQDHSAPMQRYAVRKLDELADEQLSGYVLKKDSPTCGLERVRVYAPSGVPTRTGRGLFAAALTERFPTLPVEEEGRLSDPRLRENFIERIFAYDRLRRLFEHRWTLGELVAFHGAHKMLLLAHSPDRYRRLGRLVATGKSLTKRVLEERYSTLFMNTLQVLATRKRHVNVLQHMMGHLKQALDADSKAELLSLVDRHGSGQVPLVVPLTLLRHHIRRLGVSYLAGQVYLDPHPAELMLRNHV